MIISAKDSQSTFIIGEQAKYVNQEKSAIDISKNKPDNSLSLRISNTHGFLNNIFGAAMGVDNQATFGGLFTTIKKLFSVLSAARPTRGTAPAQPKGSVFQANLRFRAQGKSLALPPAADTMPESTTAMTLPGATRLSATSGNDIVALNTNHILAGKAALDALITDPPNVLDSVIAQDRAALNDIINKYQGALDLSRLRTLLPQAPSSFNNKDNVSNRRFASETNKLQHTQLKKDIKTMLIEAHLRRGISGKSAKSAVT